MCKPIVISFCLFLHLSLIGQNETWTNGIATIIHDNCSSCHHQDAIAPFELMVYEDVVSWSDRIHHVIEERSMPPWPADPNYRHFLGEAILDQEEIDAIHNWIDGDMPYGDNSITIEPPSFLPQGSLLDRIDHTLAIEPYTLQYNGDEYRWFVIENPYAEDIYIGKIEVLPGLESVVHHVDLFIDASGNSLANDLADPLPGFNNETGFATNQQYINAWQPGANIIKYPYDWGFKIPAGSDFVIEIHFGPGGEGQIDETKINLQFIDDAVNREIKAAWLLTEDPNVFIDGPLIIPANEVVTFHQISAPLEKDISVIAICPHMHLLGKSYRVWYESPQGDSIPLIDIPRWDFHWQKYYAYPIIEKIPEGSILKSEGVYDNTLNNHDNPNDPPQTVTGGSLTEDEMFLTYFIFADYEEGDEFIVMEEEESSTTENLVLNEIDLFPNPVLDAMSWRNGTRHLHNVQFEILNVEGKLMKQFLRNQIAPDEEIGFNLSELENGIYFLRWSDRENIHFARFIKI